MLRIAAAAALSASALFAAAAHDFAVGDLRIGHPWAKPSMPGRSEAAAYFVVRNVGDAPDRIVAARAAVAEAVELHAHVASGDVMKMQRVDAVEIPPGGEIAFAPGGHHVMLFGLSEPLEIGDSFPMTLVFERAGEADVVVKVESLADYLKAQTAEEAGEAPAHHGGR